MCPKTLEHSQGLTWKLIMRVQQQIFVNMSFPVSRSLLCFRLVTNFFSSDIPLLAVFQLLCARFHISSLSTCTRFGTTLALEALCFLHESGVSCRSWSRSQVQGTRQNPQSGGNEWRPRFSSGSDHRRERVFVPPTTAILCVTTTRKLVLLFLQNMRAH